MRRRFWTTVGGLLLLGAAQGAKATDVFLETGLHGGGDKFATVFFTSGDSEDINAGELLSFAIGGIIPLNETLETQITLGWKYDGISADNGDISFERYPFNALLFYKGEYWRVGGGATYHMSPELSGSGVASGIQTDFDDAWGTLVELGYQFDIFYIGGRATFIDYESQGASAQTFDGDSVGVIFGARF